MKTYLCIGLSFLLFVFATAYYAWWSPEEPEPRAEPLGAAAREDKDVPIKPFLPTGWKVNRVREEVLEKINIPHLHKKLVGKKVRIADIEGQEIVFSHSKPNEYRNTKLTKGRIILLAETDQLVRIELFEADAVEKLSGEVSLEIADHVYDSTRETYERLAPEPPKVPFDEILDTVRRRSIGDVKKSRRIEAGYMVYSQDGISEPQVVWAVTCYGFPGGVRGRGLSRLRHLLNSEGEMLRVSSDP